MKYVPFILRALIVLVASVFIAKWLGVSFGSVVRHILWIVASFVVYYLAIAAHLALERHMLNRITRGE